jgi:hypothetical protein
MAGPDDSKTQAYISGIYLCRALQSTPMSVPAVVRRNAWQPAVSQSGGYQKDGTNVFQSPDKTTCHVQTSARIDVGYMRTWLDYTAENEWLETRFAWNETRSRPLRGDWYRVWRWESWHKDLGIGKGLLSHEVVVLPAATQPLAGEMTATATVSYRAKSKD